MILTSPNGNHRRVEVREIVAHMLKHGDIIVEQIADDEPIHLTPIDSVTDSPLITNCVRVYVDGCHMYSFGNLDTVKILVRELGNEH